MQYNESLYNGDSYNLTEYAQTLVETITPTDGTLTFSVEMLRTDSQGTADAISGNAALQAFLETVTIYQRANTPFAYNNGRYNDFMYNSRADDDEILLMAGKFLTGDVTLTDFMPPFLIDKELLETITSADTLSMLVDAFLSDAVFMPDTVRVEVSNKALNDTLRLGDWVSIQRRPFTEEWSD